MLPLLRERDCPLSPLAAWRVAIVGYGNQGTAHAQNLRDQGTSVVIGARPGGRAAARAGADGFSVLPPVEAVATADLAVLLAPDETHLELLAAIRGVPSLRAIGFAHGFCLRFQDPPLDSAWDVFVVAPAGPGVQVRARFLAGRGVPALLAVYQDGSGEAWARAKAYAAGIGSARAGVFVVAAADETEVDLFGEQSVLCGGMSALLEGAFETLVAAGYPDEMAYLECVQQLRLTAELVERFGIEGMRRRISPTALFGDLTRGPRVAGAATRGQMAAVLAEIRDGRFAREWLAAAAERPGWAADDLAAVRNERLERAGERVRSLFDEGKGVDSSGGG